MPLPAWTIPSLPHLSLAADQPEEHANDTTAEQLSKVVGRPPAGMMAAVTHRISRSRARDAPTEKRYGPTESRAGTSQY